MSARKTHNVLVIGVKMVMQGVMEDACQRGRMVWRATMTMRAHVQQANAFVIYVDLDIAKEKSVQTMITVIQAFIAITSRIIDALVHARLREITMKTASIMKTDPARVESVGAAMSVLMVRASSQTGISITAK